MTRSMKQLARTTVAVLILLGLGGARIAATKDAEVIVAAGTLDDRFLADSLFHIGEFWMKVPGDTEFNRWLSQGINRKVVIRLMTNPARFADDKNVRILSGTLMHSTAPDPTPVMTDVVGRLPNGNTPVVHVLYLKDEVTGSLGPITFETADLVTARKFDAYDSTPISIVIEIK